MFVSSLDGELAVICKQTLGKKRGSAREIRLPSAPDVLVGGVDRLSLGKIGYRQHVP